MKKLFCFFISFVFFQIALSQNKVVIYWDTSYSMNDRKVEREFNYIDNYFKKYKDSEVLLVTFSNTIILEEKYSVTNGNWQTLKAELENTVYDGATSYSDLFNHEADAFLLFSDGIENLNQLDPKINKPIHIISTVKDPQPKIKRIADASSGSYVVLNKDFDNLPYRHQKELVKKESTTGYVSGIITSNNESLSNANILNRNNNEGATSSIDGSYKIKADSGDILIFTYLGKKTVTVKVSQADFINIVMTNIDETLDEVVVNANVEREELVNTGNKMVDSRSIGYSVETISSDDITDTRDIKTAVSGQFSNFTLPNNDEYDRVDISQFLGRGNNMTIMLNQYGLVVIDGVPLAQSDSGSGTSYTRGVTGNTYSHSNIINPDLIASVTYLKGLAATNKYGTLGRNGVLLITTKNALVSKSTKKGDVVLGTTETYTEDAQVVGNLPQTKYIASLKKSSTIDEAFNTYLEERKVHGENADFFIDAYAYFEGWNNAFLSDRILSNVYEGFFDNAEALRALAFKQIEKKTFKEALFTYKRVLKLKPNQSQSYKDVAMAETLAGNHQEALKLYDRIDKQRNVGKTNFSGITKTITNDFKNLINQNASKVNTAGVNPKYLKAVKHKKRIVFEWSNPESQFDLQIVNPQKRFFTWPHTKKEAAQRLAEEKQQGYCIEEFYLTSSDAGDWLFNVKYYGNTNKNEIPEYLKITVYSNFGYPNESKEVKVVKLAEKGKLQTVVKLTI